MAVDNKKIAEDVLAAVGGASNVTNATHCMTRLRLNLKDQSIPNDDEVKKIKGVLGAQWSGGQYQVIIGQNVPKVYDAALKLGVKGEGAIAENLDASAKEPLTLKTAGKKTLNYLSKTMVMTIPIIMGAAMFRTIAVLCGDGMLGIWSADSDIYNFFYNWIYNAGLKGNVAGRRLLFPPWVSGLGCRKAARLQPAARHDARRRAHCPRVHDAGQRCGRFGCYDHDDLRCAPGSAEQLFCDRASHGAIYAGADGRREVHEKDHPRHALHGVCARVHHGCDDPRFSVRSGSDWLHSGQPGRQLYVRPR